MPELILTEEQVRILSQTYGPVVVRDASGTILGRVERRLTPEMIAELKRRAAEPGPRYTGQQVHTRLRALQEEWDRTEGFDIPYALEFVARLNAADPGHTRSKEQVARNG